MNFTSSQQYIQWAVNQAIVIHMQVHCQLIAHSLEQY